MKGIDIVIEKQLDVFTDYLWTTFSCSFYGRSQTNYRDNKEVPEILVSGNDYQDVLLDDRKDAISFFDVLPERTETVATVDIYFAVSLATLYSSVTERATEYALSEVLEWIHKGGIFTVESITDGYESWEKWSMVKKEDNMQPFYLFKIRTKVNYNLTC